MYINRRALFFSSVLLLLVLFIAIHFVWLWRQYKDIENNLENSIIVYIESVNNSIDSVLAFENGGDTSIAEQDCVVTLFALKEYNSFDRKANLYYIDRLISCYYRRLSYINEVGLNGQTKSDLKSIDKYLKLFRNSEGNKLSEKITNFNEQVWHDEEFSELIRKSMQ